MLDSKYWKATSKKGFYEFIPPTLAHLKKRNESRNPQDNVHQKTETQKPYNRPVMVKQEPMHDIRF